MEERTTVTIELEAAKAWEYCELCSSIVTLMVDFDEKEAERFGELAGVFGNPILKLPKERRKHLNKGWFPAYFLKDGRICKKVF